MAFMITAPFKISENYILEIAFCFILINASPAEWYRNRFIKKLKNIK